METNNSFVSAIGQTIQAIQDQIKNETVDIDLIVNNCIKEFNTLNLPFYSIAKDPEDKNRIIIEVPFLRECHIDIVPQEQKSHKKYLILFIDKKPVRRIKLEGYTPEYVKQVVHFALDYLKRFLLLKNKFLS